jgi:hypothetical protein
LNFRRTGLLCALLAFAGAARGAAPDAADSCEKLQKPGDMLERGQGDPDLLYRFASCREAATQKRGSCDYLSGGKKAKWSSGPVIAHVAADGEVRIVSSSRSCDSWGAGYRIIAGVLSGESDSRLLDYARLMTDGDAASSAQDIVNAYHVVHGDSKAPAGARERRLIDFGFFEHMRGLDACAKVSSPRLRGECERKAAFIEALRFHDSSRCTRDDVICRAVLDGDGACEELGRRAVLDYCGKKAEKPSV